MVKGDEKVDALLGILELGSQIYATNKQADNQIKLAEIEADTLRKNQDFELSKMYISSELEREKDLINYGLKLQDDATKLGLTIDSLDVISPESKTSGTDGIVKRDAENIANNINSTNEAIISTRNKIGEYYKGQNLAKTIDANIDGVVSDEELDQYMDESGINLSSSARIGIKSYTLTPEQRITLEGSKIELEGNKIKKSWLNKTIQQEYDINDVKLKIDNKTLIKMDNDLKAAENDVKLQDQQIVLNDITIDQKQLEVDVLKQTKNITDIDNQLVSFGELSVQNLEAQTNLGILASSKIQWGDAEDFQMLYTMLTSQDMESVKNIATKMSYNEDISLLVGDISKMYTAISTAKGDASTNDYTAFLEIIDNQMAFKSTLENFVNTYYQVAFEEEIRNGVTISPADVWFKPELMKEFMNRTIGFDKTWYDDYIGIDSDYEDHQVNFLTYAENDNMNIDYANIAPIFKGYQWYTTGLFDDLGMLDQIQRTIKQHKSINSNIEILNVTKLDIIQGNKEVNESLDNFYMKNFPKRTSY